MTYNAIIREYHSVSVGFPVVGRVLLQDLKQVPASWRIQHRGKEKKASSTNLNELLCSSEEPLHLYRPLPPCEVSKVIVEDCIEHSGRLFEIRCSLDFSVGKLACRLCKVLGAPVSSCRLVYDGRRLNCGERLRDLGIQNGDLIRLFQEQCGGGGGGFSSVDLEGSQLNGESEGTAIYSWSGYTIGLNLYGVCPNENCISKRGTSGGEVVVHAKYGVVRMTQERNKFQCTACKSVASEKSDQDDTSKDGGNVGMFTPKNFLICYGRSLFRFKKYGWDQPVKMVLMESLGLSDQFKMFDESEGSCEYDFIEIVTVGKEESPYFCVACDHSIDRSDSEVILDCGHAYHRRCRPTSGECYICDAKQFSSIFEVLGLEEVANRHDNFSGLESPRGESSVGSKPAWLMIAEEEFGKNLQRLGKEEMKDKEAKKEVNDDEMVAD